MSPFIPYIAISQFSKLPLPEGFQPNDIKILEDATTEERALVVNAGCVALRGLLDKRNEISKGNDYKQGKDEGIATESLKCQQEKKRMANDYETKVKELKNELQALQEENNHLNTSLTTANTLRTTAVAEANTMRATESEKINRTRALVESEASDKIKNLTEEINAKKAEAEKIASDLREAQQKFFQDLKNMSSEYLDNEKNSREQLKLEYEAQFKDIKLTMQNQIESQKKIIDEMSLNFKSEKILLTEELKNAQAAKEKAAEEANRAKDEKFEEIRTAERRVRDELTPKIEDLNGKLLNLTHRQANPSIKGKDNEEIFAELLDQSFGTSSDHYQKLPKANGSGDHIIEWKDMKFMFENKKYAEMVPKSEVVKALRDFKKHTDCNVLIFVSEDSNIINRKPRFDITTEDGRPAIWIGEFSHNEYKVGHLQLVGKVAEELVRLQRREKKFENGEEIVDYQKKVKDLIQSFVDTKQDLDNLLKLQKKCQSEQNKIWKNMKDEIVSVIARFESRKRDANGNKDEENCTDDVDTNSTPSTAKKPRKTPAKKKSPVNSDKNSIRNHFSTVPLEVPSTSSDSLTQFQTKNDAVEDNSYRRDENLVCID